MLDGGSITSNFGDINNGSSSITTTGKATFGEAEIDQVIINDNQIGIKTDTDLITLTDELIVSTGDIKLAENKSYQIDNSTVLTETTLGSTIINSSLQYVGVLDGGSITSNFGDINNGSSSITTTGKATFGEAEIDQVIINDNQIGIKTDTDLITLTDELIVSTGDIKLAENKSYQIDNSTVLTETTLGSTIINSSLQYVGVLDGGSITANFGDINNGSSSITTTGKATFGEAEIDQIVIDNNQIGIKTDTNLITLTDELIESTGDIKLAENKSYQIDNSTVLTETTLGSTVINSSLQYVGVLDGGSITANFGDINNGSSSITTTGKATFGKAEIDQVIINDNQIGIKTDTDLIILTDELIESTGDIKLAENKSYQIDDSIVLTETSLGTTVINSSLQYVGVLDGGSITSNFGDINNGSSSITTTGKATFGEAEIDQVIINDNQIGIKTDTDLIILTDELIESTGDIKLAQNKSYQIDDSIVLTETSLGSTVINSSLQYVGILDGGSISSNFGDINNGSSSITTTGKATFGEAEIDQIIINDNQIGIKTDTDLITLTDELIESTGDIKIAENKSYQIDDSIVLTETTLGPTVINSSLQYVGVLDGGSITSNFGDINNGSSSITTTGKATFGEAEIDQVIINDNQIGIKTDTDLIILTDELIESTGDIKIAENKSYQIDDSIVLTETTLGPTVINSSLQYVGVLDGGSISSNFGDINNGSSSITTTGKATFGEAEIDQVIINNNQIGIKTDTDLITLTDELIESTGDIKLASTKSYQIDTSTVLTETTLGPTVINSSLQYVGVLDGGSISSNFGDINNGSSSITTTGKATFGEAEIDQVIINDNQIGIKTDTDLITLTDELIESTGDIKLAVNKSYQIDDSIVLTETILGPTVINSSLQYVGVLDGGSISSNFGDINNGSSSITTTGKATFGEAEIDQVIINDNQIGIKTDTNLITLTDELIESTGDIKLASTKSYQIDTSTVLTETTLGPTVINSSLQYVGVLDGGSISSNFGDINNGSSSITTTGKATFGKAEIDQVIINDNKIGIKTDTDLITLTDELIESTGDIKLAENKSYQIDDSIVLTETTLGPTVINSSLQYVGVLDGGSISSNFGDINNGSSSITTTGKATFGKAEIDQVIINDNKIGIKTDTDLITLTDELIESTGDIKLAENKSYQIDDSIVLTETTLGPTVINSSLQYVGVLDGGSISSNFGDINNGSSSITTTGKATFGKAEIDQVIINDNQIGIKTDTDLITLTDELIESTGDIKLAENKSYQIDDSIVLTETTLGTTVINSSLQYVGVLDGGSITSNFGDINNGSSSITTTGKATFGEAEIDQVIINDNQIGIKTDTDLITLTDELIESTGDIKLAENKSYQIDDSIVLTETTLGTTVINSSLQYVGVLDGGSITSNFGDINNGSSSITTTGKATFGEAEIDQVIINDNQIGIKTDTDLITLTDELIESTGDIKLAENKSYQIDDSIVLTETTLGPTVINSSLQYVGVLDGGSISSNFGDINNGSSSITTTGKATFGKAEIDQVIINDNQIGIKTDTDLITLTDELIESTGDIKLAENKSYQIDDSIVLTETTLGTTVINSSLQYVGVLDGGSITSNFGDINNGSSSITTTGKATFGEAEIDQVIINDNQIGIKTDTDLITLTDELIESTGDIKLAENKSYQIDDSIVLTETTLGTTVINSSLQYVGVLDGGSITSNFGDINNGSSSITTTGKATFGEAEIDQVIINDNQIGIKTDTDLITLTDELIESTGDIKLAENKSYQIDDSIVLTETTLGTTVINSSLQYVGVLDGGSITSNFGDINNGSSSITTTGKATFGEAEIDQIIINNNQIGIKTDTDLITLTDELIESTGDIKLASTKSYQIDTSTVLTETTLGPTVINSSLQYVGVLDGGSITSNFGDINNGSSSITTTGKATFGEAEIDQVVINDNQIGIKTDLNLITLTDELIESTGDIKLASTKSYQIDTSTVLTETTLGPTVINSSLQYVGVLDGGSITSNFGDINNGSSSITTTGKATFGEAEIDQVVINDNQIGIKSDLNLITLTDELIESTGDIKLAENKSYQIDTSTVLTETTLGLTVVNSFLQYVGVLDGGSISSNFGDINNGSSSITTTGKATFGEAEIDQVVINDNQIGIKTDLNLITLTDELIESTGDIKLAENKSYQIDTSTVLTETTLGLTVVNSFLQYVGVLDGGSISSNFGDINNGSSSITTTGKATFGEAEIDQVVINDNQIGIKTDTNLITLTDELIESTGDIKLAENKSYQIDTSTVLTETTLGPTVVNSFLQYVGVLDGGSITSNFGDINNGSSSITTTGKATFGEAEIDQVVINNNQIGIKTDLNLITLTDELIELTGDIKLASTKSYQIDTSTVLTETTLGPTVINSSLQYVGVLDGGSITANFGDINNGSSSITTTGKATFGEAEIDQVVINDNQIGIKTDLNLITLTDELIELTGDIKLASTKSYQIDTSTVLTETTLGPTVINSSLQYVGVLDGGSITANFGDINNGSSSITTTGKATFGEAEIDQVVINDNQIGIKTDLNLITLTDELIESTGDIKLAENKSYQIDTSTVLTETTLGPTVVNSFLQYVGVLDGGSITANFGDINNGSSSITTTGKATFGEAEIDQVVIDDNQIGIKTDLNLITLTDELIESTGDIKLASTKSYQIDTSTVLTETTLGPTVINSSLQYVGVLDGGSITANFGDINNGSSSITTTGKATFGEAEIDQVVIDNNQIGIKTDLNLITLTDELIESTGDIKLAENKSYQIDTSTVLTETTLGPTVINSSLQYVGVLDGGSITSNFGDINNGSSSITTTGKATFGEAEIDQVVIDNNQIGIKTDLNLITLTDELIESTGDIKLAENKSYQIDTSTVLTETTLGPTVINSSLQYVGVLDGGSITDNFGDINNGSSSITTTGKATFGEAEIDQIVIDNNQIGIKTDLNLITLRNELIESTGDIKLAENKSYQIDTSTVLTETTLGPTVINSSLQYVGVLDGGSITSNFGNINIGSSYVATKGTGYFGKIIVDDITIDQNRIGFEKIRISFYFIKTILV